MENYTLEEISLMKKVLILQGMKTEAFCGRDASIDRYNELKSEFNKKLHQLIQLTMETYKFNVPAKELTSENHVVYCYGRLAGNVTEEDIPFLKDKIHRIVDDYMHKVVENGGCLDLDEKGSRFVFLVCAE